MKEAREDYLTAVRAIVRDEEAGSFSKAADSLELPSKTVTKSVQSLEAHQRVKLLKRTTRQGATTSDGSIYYTIRHGNVIMRSMTCCVRSMSPRDKKQLSARS